MSVLITSPACCCAFRADWRRPHAWFLAAAAILVLIPDPPLLRGGWLQYGYRYFLDSVPFVLGLCGSRRSPAAASAGAGRPDRHRIAVMGIGVYWAYNL
jgi:hypothetical protein